MRTALEMDSRATKGYEKNKNTLKHFEIIEKILVPGEEAIMTLTVGKVLARDAGDVIGLTAVAFTNHKRLLYGRKGFTGEHMQVINLDYINDIIISNGLWFSLISMNTPTVKVVIEVEREIAETVFKSISDLRENYYMTNNKVFAQVASPYDELKKVKELLDMGIITQEDFDAKKKQLLGL